MVFHSISFSLTSCLLKLNNFLIYVCWTFCRKTRAIKTLNSLFKIVITICGKLLVIEPIITKSTPITSVDIIEVIVYPCLRPNLSPYKSTMQAFYTRYTFTFLCLMRIQWSWSVQSIRLKFVQLELKLAFN